MPDLKANKGLLENGTKGFGLTLTERILLPRGVHYFQDHSREEEGRARWGWGAWLKVKHWWLTPRTPGSQRDNRVPVSS